MKLRTQQAAVNKGLQAKGEKWNPLPPLVTADGNRYVEPSEAKTAGKGKLATGVETREGLCGDLTQIINSRSEELEKIGYLPELARFDCLITLKMIIDELYDQFNVGHARKEWYREHLLKGRQWQEEPLPNADGSPAA